jgi:glycerol-3-phosphate cytidylyltransferase-like family protein
MNFVQYLNKSKDQLDVSIQAADKWLTSDAKIGEFLAAEVEVEHKTDGVKLTIIKQANNSNIDDYIFAYKGNILYSSEFDYQPNTKVKSESIGASQFKTVFQHFNKLGKNSIPVGTELFIEFLMSKPTLSSNYSTKHKMVLIGYSKSSWKEKFGKLKTSPSGMETSAREKYAKELKIDVPQLLFTGVMGSQISFAKGISNSILKSEFEQRKGSMNWDNAKLLLDDLRVMFLDIESKYGGKEEGVVLKYNNRLLKWQQEYQLDKEARAAIKMKYKEDDWDTENAYWSNVTRTALEISNSFTVKSRKLPDLMEELAIVMKRLKLDFTHSKKTTAMIKDDIQLTAKTQIIKQMRGNNNALILGKFRVLTQEGHYKLVKRASTLYDNVVICIVTSKDTAETKELRTKMMETVFPNVEIIHHSNGNLLSILNKSPININVVYAGSDRVSEYQKQLKNSLGVNVRELPRTDDDISASKVITNIEDREFYKKATPKELHQMYDEVLKTYA